MPVGHDQKKNPETAWKKYFNQNGKRPVLALLSLAAYLDKPPFLVLGGQEFRPTLHYPQNKVGAKGLAYTVFDEFEKGRHTGRVIAYRGTEATHLNDWLFGNLPLLRFQYRDAVRQFPKLVQGLGADVKVYVTGHSLGGGIAITVHRYYEERLDITRVFNASPVMGCLSIFREKCKSDRELLRKHETLTDAQQSEQEMLWANAYEAGDPTRVVGNALAFWRWSIFNKDRHRFYRRYNFLPAAFISDHDIDKFTYHLAGYQSNPRHDIATAAIALQCLRKNKEKADRCQSEILEARSLTAFSERSAGNVTDLDDDGVAKHLADHRSQETGGSGE